MTPEKQRIAIAEACGWELVIRWRTPGITPMGVHPSTCGWVDVPDYLNNLNAMHQAEKVFQNDALLWHRYAALIDKDYVNQPYTIGATAAQRAEAFLRTLNLWEYKSVYRGATGCASGEIKEDEG